MLDSGFYNMDCMEGMRSFPDGHFDLAIVDPPYGINVGKGNKGRVYGHNKRAASTQKQYKFFDDTRPPSADYFRELFRVSKHQIIWGGQLLSRLFGRGELSDCVG